MSILSDNQKKIFSLLSKEKIITDNFYLSGGTALAEFYLNHRLSEDLDFFTDTSEVSVPEIEKFLRAAQQKLSIQKTRYQTYRGLHMFFLTYANGTELKIDFNYYPFPRIEKGMVKFGVHVDSLHDIGVNKIQTIATRTTARDFVDLYWISQSTKFTFPKLITDARAKFDWYIEPIQFGKQFLKVRSLTDYPRMILPLSPSTLQSFFLKEAKKLGKEILG